MLLYIPCRVSVIDYFKVLEEEDDDFNEFNKSFISEYLNKKQFFQNSAIEFQKKL